MKITVRSYICKNLVMDYIKFGNGEKTFVILPGIGVKSPILSADAVEKAYSVFENDYTIYLFNRKNNIEPGYLTSDMVEDTAFVMQKLGIKDAYVFGASHGGMMGMLLAARHPELVKKLVVGSSSMKPNPISENVFETWCRLVREKDRVSLNRNVNSHVYTKSYYEKYADVFKSLEDSGTEAELERFGILSNACKVFDLGDEVQNISCPVLVIGAELDRVLTCNASLEIAKAIPGSELFVYNGYGHAAYDEAPDYKERLISFFNK